MIYQDTIYGETLVITDKKNAQLPEHAAAQLKAARDTSNVEFYAWLLALREQRWPLRAIGDVFGVTRVAAKAWVTRAEASPDARKRAETVDVPRLPVNARGSGVKARKIVPDVPVSERERIKELTNIAKDVRRWTPEDSAERNAARELEKLLYHYAYRRNVPVTKLAEHAGVSRRAVAQRLEKQARIES